MGLAQPGGLGGLAGQLDLEVNRPGGPNEFSFHQFNLIQNSNLNANTNSFQNSNQIPNF
jgi:hypothetical protein